MKYLKDILDIIIHHLQQKIYIKPVDLKMNSRCKPSSRCIDLFKKQLKKGNSKN